MLSAAGASTCVAVAAGEGGSGAESTLDGAAANGVEGDGARAATSIFAPSTAAGAVTSRGCNEALRLLASRMTAVMSEPFVGAAEARAAASCRMAPGVEDALGRSGLRVLYAAMLAWRRGPCLSTAAQAPTRRCTSCGAEGKAAASRQQPCHWQGPQQQTTGCHRRESFAPSL